MLHLHSCILRFSDTTMYGIGLFLRLKNRKRVITFQPNQILYVSEYMYVRPQGLKDKASCMLYTSWHQLLPLQLTTAHLWSILLPKGDCLHF